MKIEFSLEPSSQKEDGFVVRTGKIFEVGEFHDKDFNLSLDEMDSAAKNHTVKALNIEHMPTIFDLGKLGDFGKVWHDGKQLFADVRVDADVDHYLQKHNIPLKVSAEWDRETKTLQGLALVRNPRIEDAALYAAFTKGGAEFAGSAMAKLHDTATYAGAECNGKSVFSETVNFMTPDELKTVQKVHDLCSGGGKHCDLMASRNAMYSVSGAQPRAGKGETMFDKLKALFTRAGVPEEEIKKAFDEMEEPKTLHYGEALRIAPAVKFSDSDEYKAMFATMNAQAELVKKLQEDMASQQANAEFSSVEAAIDALVKPPFAKITPAQAAQYKEKAKASPSTFSEHVLPVLQSLPTLPMFSAPVRVAAGGDAASASAKLDSLTKERMKTSGEDYVTAMMHVTEENKELANAQFAAGRGE